MRLNALPFFYQEGQTQKSFHTFRTHTLNRATILHRFARLIAENRRFDRNFTGEVV